jgi:hypothetical protein
MPYHRRLKSPLRLEKVFYQTSFVGYKIEKMEDCNPNRDPRGEIGPPTVVTDSVKVHCNPFRVS